MLTRRHIRVKVMQAIYALSQSAKPSMEEQEKFLQASMENMYNLYLSMLRLLIEIHKTAESRLNLSQKKYLATQEEKNPNLKFVNNRVLFLLRNNLLLNEECKKRNLPDWSIDDRYVQDIYETVTESALYMRYMTSATTSFKEDREFCIAFYTDCIAQDEKLYTYLEDYKITWADDIPVINTYLVKMLQSIEPGTSQHYFFVPLYKDKEDKIFAQELFRRTVVNNEILEAEIKGKTTNWDIERIASIDLILLKMAVCEFLKFPNIPVKATINEYLEIAKEYSTLKSSLFINGVLDKIVKEYTTANKLNKIGRGLL